MLMFLLQDKMYWLIAKNDQTLSSVKLDMQMSTDKQHKDKLITPKCQYFSFQMQNVRQALQKSEC